MAPTALGKALRIEKELLTQLRQGRWQEGEQIPSELELARQYGVCRVTVKKALASLSSQGRLVSRQGRGHFARRPAERRRTWTVGVAVQAERHIEHPVTIQTLGGLQRALLGTSFHMKVIVQYKEAPGDAAWTPKRVLHPCTPVDVSSLDGFITHVYGLGEEVLRALSEEIPICCTDWYEPGRRLSSVRSDMAGGVAAAMGRLITLGHERIALFHAEPFQRKANADGARMAVMAHHLDDRVRARHMEIEDYTEAHGAAAARELWALPPAERPTALIGAAEAVAGFWRTAREMDRTGAAGLSLVAINPPGEGRGDAAFAEVPAALMRIDHRAIGEAQGRELLRLISEPESLGREHLEAPGWQYMERLRPPSAAGL